MKPIDNYMTVSEAAHKYGKSIETVKNKLKPSIKGQEEVINQMLKDGLIKYFQKPDGQRKEWIVTTEAMDKWFKK